ncbi:MAG: transketolase [Sphingobacteriales bacterium]|jgi:transketolase
MKEISELKSISNQVRRDIVRMVHACQSGHPGGSLGCADYFVALYNGVMNHDSSFNMDAKNEDVFFLSNGHISPVWYSTLARCGYFEVSELASFRKLNSRLQGHPATEEGLPGIRIASGSLGQGLSSAAGTAMGKKINGDKSLVFSLHGDGELQEGQIWEAAMFAAHQKIDNLISTIDYNGRQIDGDVDDILTLGDLEGKWKAFGWEVLKAEGNNMESIVNTLNHAKTLTGKGKPIMILMATEMGAGVDFMMGSHEWHGIAPNDEQLANALSQLEETMGDY